MLQSQRVTIPETGTGLGITSRATWLPCFIVIVALMFSGCRTTAELVAERPGKQSGAGATDAISRNASTGAAVTVARLQSPGGGPLQDSSARSQPGLPPLPDPGLPATASAVTQPAFDEPPADGTVATPPSDPATVVPPQAGAVLDRNSPELRGLSSIARNRLRNRQAAGGVSSSGGGVSGGAAATGATGSANPRPSGMSSILRNRVRGEAGAEGPQFDFPDIRADPADIYHDRFGLVDEEH